MYIQVDTQYDQVRKDVQKPHAEQNIGVVERDLLRDLHHHQDDAQVRSVEHKMRESQLAMWFSQDSSL